MATPISRVKRLVKMLERLNKQPYLYDEDQVKLIKVVKSLISRKLSIIFKSIQVPQIQLETVR